MATTPNYGWVMPDPTDFVTDLPADFEIFGDAVDLTVDTIETKLDVITTEGDLVIGDASGDPVRLPVGALGTVLTSDGTTAGFAAISAGGISLLSTTTMSGTTTSVTGISGSFKNLYIEVENADAALNFTAVLRLNGSSTLHFFNSENSTGTAVFGQNVDITLNHLNFLAGSNNFTSILIDNYSSSTSLKTFIVKMMGNNSVGGGTAVSKYSIAGFNSTSAITSIDIVTNEPAIAGTIRIFGVS